LGNKGFLFWFRNSTKETIPPSYLKSWTLSFFHLSALSGLHNSGRQVPEPGREIIEAEIHGLKIMGSGLKTQ
jgi:hypothetical protein